MGRKPKLTPHQMTEARKRIAKGELTRDLAKSYRCQRQHDFEADMMTGSLNRHIAVIGYAVLAALPFAACAMPRQLTTVSGMRNPARLCHGPRTVPGPRL